MKKFECQLKYYPEHIKIRSSSIKSQVMKRDKVCQKCGGNYSLHIHHIVPLMYGGSDTLGNCILLCSECHNYAPDEPYLFFKYLKRSYSIRTDLIPLSLKIYTSFLIKNCRAFDDVKELCERYIKTNYSVFNINKEMCFWYRNSKNIWEKEDLDDLFDLSLVTDCVFGKISYKEKTKEENRLDFINLSEKERIEKINNFIQYSKDKITYRLIGRKFCMNHMSIKNLMEKWKLQL